MFKSIVSSRLTKFLISILFINLTTAQYTEDCGTTYGCFRVPVGCRNSDCEFIVKWQNSPSYTTFVLQTHINSSSVFDAWTAVGFSNDMLMGSESVVMCRHSSIARNGGIETYYNTPQMSNVLDASNPMLGLFNSQMSIINRHLTCRFSRQKNFPGRSMYSNLTSPNRWHILVASGTTNNFGTPLYHAKMFYANQWLQNFESLSTAGPDPITTAKPVPTTTKNQTHNVTSDKKKTHACLMIFTWMFLGCTGILLPRYYKYLYTPKKVLSKDLWFILHVGIMVTVALLNLAGFLTILSELDWKWVETDKPLELTHSIFGIMSFGLIYLQILIGFCRPHKESSLRKAFRIVHRSAGLIAFIFAIIAMYLGVLMKDINLDRLGWCIVTGWLLWVIILPLIIEILKLTKLGANKRNLAYKLTGTLRENYEIIDRYQKIFNGIKSSLLALHLIIVLGLALTLIVFIGVTDSYLW